MGRFSRLETERRSGATAPVPRSPELVVGGGSGVVPPADPDAFAGAADFVAEGDRALFMEDRRQALRWYSRAVDQDPTRRDAWTRVIETLLTAGDLSEAAAWIKRGLVLTPEDPRLLALRAVEHARRGMVRQAMAGTDAALELAADDPLVNLARGQVLLLADNTNATWCFDQAVKLSPPDDWKTPALVALVLRERRLWAKAIDYLARAIDRNERQPLLWYQVGLCRAALGHKAHAAKAFDTARELCKPDDPLIRKLNHASTGTLWRRVRTIFGRG